MKFEETQKALLLNEAFETMVIFIRKLAFWYYIKAEEPIV